MYEVHFTVFKQCKGSCIFPKPWILSTITPNPATFLYYLMKKWLWHFVTQGDTLLMLGSLCRTETILQIRIGIPLVDAFLVPTSYLISMQKLLDRWCFRIAMIALTPSVVHVPGPFPNTTTSEICLCATTAGYVLGMRHLFVWRRYQFVMQRRPSETALRSLGRLFDLVCIDWGVCIDSTRLVYAYHMTIESIMNNLERIWRSRKGGTPPL